MKPQEEQNWEKYIENYLIENDIYFMRYKYISGIIIPIKYSVWVDEVGHDLKIEYVITKINIKEKQTFFNFLEKKEGKKNPNGYTFNLVHEYDFEDFEDEEMIPGNIFNDISFDVFFTFLNNFIQRKKSKHMFYSYEKNTTKKE